jgi:hypothetical protein
MKPLVFVLVLVVLTCAGRAEAQSGKLKDSQGRLVFVIDEDRREWQGRLLKVSADALEVESDVGVRTFKLADIRRVDADSDSVRDGILKGAAFGLALGALTGGLQGGGARFLVGGTLTYGLIGLIIDASCQSRHTVYHSNASPQVSMKVSW